MYAPFTPCTSRVNLENNNEGDGHDPIYDHELYLDNVAGLLTVIIMIIKINVVRII